MSSRRRLPHAARKLPRGCSRREADSCGGDGAFMPSAARKFLSSEMCSRTPIAPMIWSFARKGIESHTSGADAPSGTTFCGPMPPKRKPFACAM